MTTYSLTTGRDSLQLISEPFLINVSEMSPSVPTVSRGPPGTNRSLETDRSGPLLYTVYTRRHSLQIFHNCLYFVFGAPVRGEAVRFTQRPLVTKNENDGLSDSERISMIGLRSVVLIQSTRVTDGRTELPWHIRAIAYAVAPLARKNL